MDPQQKQLLQCVYRALENAGIPMEKASGTRTGVFFGKVLKAYLCFVFLLFCVTIMGAWSKTKLLFIPELPSKFTSIQMNNVKMISAWPVCFMYLCRNNEQRLWNKCCTCAPKCDQPLDWHRACHEYCSKQSLLCLQLHRTFAVLRLCLFFIPCGSSSCLSINKTRSVQHR